MPPGLAGGPYQSQFADVDTEAQEALGLTWGRS